jgi:hypothetical protein
VSETQTTGYAGSASGRFVGVMLMTVGGLIATLSGLCSAGVLAMMIASPGDASMFVLGLLLVGVVGGIPTAVGVVLVFIGRSVYRSNKPRPDPNTFS